MSIWDRVRIEGGRAAWAWGEAFAASQFAFLRLAHGDAPIPLDVWRRAADRTRALTDRDEPLYRSPSPVSAQAAALPLPLTTALGDTSLGEWALDAETAQWLWRAGMRNAPKRIVECGGGVSTILNACLLRELGAAGGAVITLEEDPQYATALRERIAGLALAPWVTVLDAPIDATGNYRFDPSTVLDRIGGTADWLFVDGPKESRERTVPSLAAVAREGTRWFLDDALGDSYFATTAHWAEWPGIRTDGIVAVGKGLAVGSITDPAAALVAAPVRRRPPRTSGRRGSG
jgi:predicted O-methyltransferase YrrM